MTRTEMKPDTRRPPGLTLALAAIAYTLASGLPTQAAEHDDARIDVQAQYWAAACANCHGTNGQAVPDASMPALAGRDADWLAQQMLDFAQGRRPSTIMHQLAKGYDEDQIRRIARWLSQQDKETP